jgi:hypothetical protein
MEQMERSPLGTGGALEAPRGRRDGRSAGGEEEDGEERRGGICSGEGARVMRPPLPRSGGGEGSTCREEGARQRPARLVLVHRRARAAHSGQGFEFRWRRAAAVAGACGFGPDGLP